MTMLKNIEKIIQESFNFRPNHNQLRDIKRLVHEITLREDITTQKLISELATEPSITEKYSGRNRFFAIKDTLIKRRYPLTSSCEKIDTKKVFMTPVKDPLKDNWQVKDVFKPLEVFVEKDVEKSYLVDNFKNKFPRVKIKYIDYYSQYLKKNKFKLSDLKKPIVFIVKERWDFIKPCPCTKQHVRCGYWILNLGFGCPYDCSYCFLQHYTNFPGIILPGNLDDFFIRFDKFHKTLKSPIRIGTGEFCDSLALDHITEYSKKLIPYFKDKKVSFELKTKSNNIENLLRIQAPDNIVIGWSLNPQNLASQEELGAAPLEERLKAAQKIQQHGYKIAFHFDPIIHSKNWDQQYHEVVDKIYSYVKPPLAWISLGTLRCNRQLKTAVELRFPKSKIFEGELLLGEDKKLRYPEFIRRKIFKSMIKYIRKHDKNTPLYLCMENKDLWQLITDKLSTADIEKYLLNL